MTNWFLYGKYTLEGVYMKLGIVGYSSGKFDESIAHILLLRGIVQAEIKSGKMISEIVSGLTDQGIPGMAYHLAVKMDNIKTVGIACSKAGEYPCFAVDEAIIIGDEWGDESETFIDYIDILLRIGGGDQSLEEVSRFKELKPSAVVVEYELAREVEA